jgi:hypothetical protein
LTASIDLGTSSFRRLVGRVRSILVVSSPRTIWRIAQISSTHRAILIHAPTRGRGLLDVGCPLDSEDFVIHFHFPIVGLDFFLLIENGEFGTLRKIGGLQLFFGPILGLR